MKKLFKTVLITLLFISIMSLLGCQQKEGTDQDRPSASDLSDTAIISEKELPQTI